MPRWYYSTGTQGRQLDDYREQHGASGARFLGPIQKMALEFAHGRVENKPDGKHDQDVGKDRWAFKEPLGVDQRRPHSAAARHHFRETRPAPRCEKL